jgi:DNA polymerase I-like protein with 3'-5' exonuclease and polymerase domains
MRGLIRPGPDQAVAYIDYSQQEFGIAAALSKDVNMMASYQSGDPYLAFAKFANAVPAEATKATHPRERNLFKTTILAVQYLAGAARLASQLGITLPEAQALLDQHHRIYAQFWAWSDSVSDYGQMYGSISATFGWTLHLTADTSLRTLRNFPMQANGSEMLRLAAIFARQAGVVIVATVHDALLIEARSDDVAHAVALTQSAMRRASEIVLAGFALRTDAQTVHYPDRFREELGLTMWQWMCETLPLVERSRAA